MIPVSMISCHLLLGEPWYKENDVGYDCQTHKYIGKKGNKCDLLPMGEDLSIVWRKEHMEKIKEWKEAKKREAEAAEIFMVVIQFANKNTIKEIDSKPETILFQGGEHDTTVGVKTGGSRVGGPELCV